MSKRGEVSAAKIMRAAAARIPIKSNRSLEESLEYVAGSMAEAYRVGVEEAQEYILGRLERIVHAPVARRTYATKPENSAEVSTAP